MKCSNSLDMLKPTAAVPQFPVCVCVCVCVYVCVCVEAHKRKKNNQEKGIKGHEESDRNSDKEL